MKCLYPIFIFFIFFSLTKAQSERISITIENAHLLSELMSWQAEPLLISNVVFSPDNQYLALVGVTAGISLLDNGKIIFLDPITLNEIMLTREQLEATSIVFSPDGALFALGTATGKLSIYTFPNFEEVLVLQAEQGQILSLAIDPNNLFIAITLGSPSTGMEGTANFQIFEIATGNEIFRFPTDDDFYGAATTFDQDSNYAFFATTERHIYQLDLISNEITLIADDFTLALHDLIYDEDWLAYVTVLDGTNLAIKLKNFEGDDELLIASPLYENDIEAIWSIGANPAHSLLASAYVHYDPNNRDAILRVWDIESAHILTTIEIPTSEDDIILDLAFSADGALLATGDSLGVLRIWGIPSEE